MGATSVRCSTPRIFAAARGRPGAGHFLFFSAAAKGESSSHFHCNAGGGASGLVGVLVVIPHTGGRLTDAAICHVLRGGEELLAASLFRRLVYNVVHHDHWD